MEAPMEEATMTKGTKFVKTSNFYTLYGPVSCSKKQGAGGSISFPRKSKQHESGHCFDLSMPLCYKSAQVNVNPMGSVKWGNVINVSLDYI